jgi:hypothetical protein
MRALEVVVIVAIIVAIGCEVLLMIYTLYEAFRDMVLGIIDFVKGDQSKKKSNNDDDETSIMTMKDVAEEATPFEVGRT